MIVLSSDRRTEACWDSGSDPNTNWTVADHNLDTDVTGHVVIVTPAGDPGDRIACGNFF